MLDFYNIDSVLSEEERAVRDSVRSFVDGRVLGLTPAQWITPVLAALGIYLLVSARRETPASPVARPAPVPEASS